MRIAVFSDTHGRTEALSCAEKELFCVEHLLHLGDGIMDAGDLSMKLKCGVFSVRGNCDAYSSVPLERVVELEGIRILLLHGHTVSSKLSLYYRAKEQGCLIACFGHSHVPALERMADVILLNPGSLSRPRSSNGPTCGLITVSNGHGSVCLLPSSLGMPIETF